MKRLVHIFYLSLAMLIIFLSMPVPVIAEDEPKMAEEMYFLDQIKEEPQNLDPYLGLGNWYLRYRKFDKAVEVLSQATSKSPNTASGYALFGDVYASQQKFSKAIEMYEIALKIEPENAGYWYALGSVYERSGKKDLALSALQKAEQYLAKSGIDPILFYQELSALYVSVGKSNEAIKLIDKLAKQEPKSASTLAAIGDIYTFLQQFDKAFPYYEQAFALNPKDTQLLSRIMGAYRNSGRTKEMVAFAKKAINKATTPELAVQIWNLTANMFYQGGNVADLIDLYDSVGKVVTDKTSRRNIRISLLNYIQNQGDSLIPIFESRYKKSPKDIEVISMLAEIYNRVNQVDKAITLYEKLRKLQPEDSRTIDSLAMLYQKKGELDKAILLRQEALSKNPDDGNNLANLARLYNRIGKKDKAEELIVKLKQKSTNNQAALNQLIVVYREFGQSEKAITAMKDYLATTQDKMNAQQMLIRYYLELNRTAEAEKELEPMLSMITTGTPEYQIRQTYDLAFSLYAKSNQIDKMIALYRQGQQLVSEQWAKNNFRGSLINNCQQAGRINQLISVLKEELTQKPGDTGLQFILANAYMQNSRYAEAIPIMEQLYSQDSNNSEYENQLLNLYQNAQNLSKVAELSQRLIARYPDQTWRYTQLIQAYMQLGKPALAEKTVKELTNRMGENPQLWATLAQINESMQKPQEAISYYEKATATNPNNIQYYTSLGRLYQQMGNDAAALNAYLKVKKFGGRDYERNQAESAIVKAYLNLGNWKAATQEFESWLNVIQNRDWQIQETLPLLITVLIQQHQVKTAWDLIVKYQQTANLSQVNIWSMPTYDYRLRDVIQQSIPLQQYLEKAIEKGSKDKSIFANLVSIYLDNNRGQARLSLAVPILEKAINQFPNEPEPYILLGDVYARQQKPQLAIEQSQKAVSMQIAAGMNPEQSSGSQFSPNNVIVRLAGLYIQVGQQEKAVALAEELKKSSNPTAELWRSVAGIYETAKEYSPAITAYQKAIALKPNESQLRTSLIKCYILAKKYPEAEQEANKLAETASQPWALQEAYRQLAQVYDKQEIYDKEIDIYLKMIDANPQNYTWGNISNDLLNWNQNQARYEGLAAVLEKKVKENPKDLNLLTILGDIYRRLGRSPVLAN
jgi:tetratricopeptide (TPR) repeat protein